VNLLTSSICGPVDIHCIWSAQDRVDKQKARQNTVNLLSITSKPAHLTYLASGVYRTGLISRRRGKTL